MSSIYPEGCTVAEPGNTDSANESTASGIALSEVP